MVEAGLVLTRSQARMLIKQGDVFCNDKLVKKPGQLVSESDSIEIKSDDLYVSRGAYKLKKALDEFKLDLTGKVVMDCGASTGGFTQVSLDNGALKVYALDVGHYQLASILRNDERVINNEGINLKYPFELDVLCDVFVMDISFISIKLVIPNIVKNLKDQGEGILLIKPQFEVGREKIQKNGLVKIEDAKKSSIEVSDWLKQHFSYVSSIIESPVKGKTGNTEYLVHVKL
jgi:23S rRNA (cytidine1920-2'-O)/16S rRNA (cytidine1409-2'-O)-methyltransferase